MTDTSAQAKWDARYRDAVVGESAPVRVLTDYAHLLPAHGKALDLACGLGANALFLAERGLTVEAWDIAPSAIEKLARYARERNLPIRATVRDVVDSPPPADGFDVIVVGRFLERRLAPALARALRPGGLLYYETFVQEAVAGGGPSNPAFRLAPNELLRLFDGLRIRVYREEGRIGDISRGLRDLAQLVGQRN